MLRASAVAMVLALATPLTHADCVKENAEVTVAGTIARETFAGPPNYESVAKGDEAELYWILTASEPVAICPAGTPEQRLQLLLDEKQYKRYKSMLGKPVVVKGAIWSAQTGHHHTNALITVAEVQPAAARAAASP